MSSYFDKALIPATLESELERAKKRLCRIKYDAIAVSGCSGTLVAGAFSIALQKPIILVRKRPEISHSGELVEAGGSFLYRRKPFRYIIVDDFVDSGDTIRRIKDAIKMKCKKAVFAGVYPYQMETATSMSISVKFRVFNPSGGLFKPRPV